MGSFGPFILVKNGKGKNSIYYLREERRIEQGSGGEYVGQLKFVDHLKGLKKQESFIDLENSVRKREKRGEKCINWLSTTSELQSPTKTIPFLCDHKSVQRRVIAKPNDFFDKEKETW